MKNLAQSCIDFGCHLKLVANYTIGEENPITGEIIETIEDCMNAVRTELENGLIDPLLEVGDIS